MKLQRTFLRSKLEKQLFGLFLSCAVVPILVLSILSYHHVTQQLYDQSRTRLHRASKATGMMLLERLLQVETELDAVIAAGGRFRRGDLSNHHFRSIEAVSEGGKRTLWLGESVELPDLSAAERAHLRAGRPLLLAAQPPAGSARILLVKSIRPDGSGGRVTAEVDRDYLFDISGENTLSPMAEFCILDEVDRVVACSLEDPGFLDALGTKRSVSGQFEWDREGRSQLAYFWSVFLKPSYHTPQWTVVLSEPEDEVFAPIASFRMTFPFAVLLSVLVVTLMCVNQIRRRLVPLKQLRDGTRRVAERDFDVDISIDSGDEFQELADSFNTMARRLEEQFDSLATMIDIDRAILSAIDRDKVVNTLIAHLRELYPCDSVAVSLVDPGAPSALRTQFSRESDAGSRTIETAGFTAIEERQLGANSESLLVDLGPDAPRYLEPHVRIGMRQCLLLPLFVGSELAGVVSLGHERAGAHDTKRLVYARQLADQTATALANVQTIEANRVLAYYDRLTGLPNRLLFKERLEQAVAAAKRHREPVATCVFDIDTRQPIGAEALVRWQHPRMGLTPPSEFIPLAEETGVIVELGKWVLETACSQNRSWQEAGFPPLALAVNVSSRQLEGEALLHTVRRVLNSSGMRGQYLILELTESMLMKADDETLKTLRGLKAMGVQLSIDDFGTGYSSLIYLKNFPLDHLKIDRTFLKDATRNENDAAITKAIIAMAHSLKLQVVAEGVELDAQMRFLRENGCDAAQGYLISDPIPADAFTKLLKESTPE